MSDARARGSSPLGALDASLHAAHRQIRLLAGVTPRNLAAERERLLRGFSRGTPTTPRWEYDAVPSAAGRAALGELRAELGRARAAFGSASGGAVGAALVARCLPESDAERRVLQRVAGAASPEPGVLLASLLDRYEERIAELEQELALLEHRGKPGFVPLAAARRRRIEARGGRARATRWTRAWLRLPPGPREEDVPTDGTAPQSLRACLARAVALLGIDFRIVLRADLSAFAATGDETLYVARGRTTSPSAAVRIALHEALGHALPRARARCLWPGLFFVGTAFGVDEQEGYALALEERYGVLDDERRRELAARHLACEHMAEGATFVEAVRSLLGADVPLEGAMLAVERAFRGGNGEGAGLGREAAYLLAFARVRRALTTDPSLEAVLASGQIALPPGAQADGAAAADLAEPE